MIQQEIERKLLDFREINFPAYTSRNSIIKEAPLMVSTIIGARRVGKSIRTLQLAEESIVQKKIPGKEHICYLDFDNPILARIQPEELTLIQLTFLKINPEFTLHTPIFFIFDEIHKISGWEEFVIELSRNPAWKVYVTGSSSKMLREDISSALRGKALSTIIYPFDFQEFLLNKGMVNLSGSSSGIAQIQRLFDEYLHWGAFPAISGASELIKEALLREYFDTMLLKDIIERYNVSKPRQCIYLLRYLLSYISKPFTINSAYEAVKNAGHATSKDSVKDYIDWAEDSLLCSRISIFSGSIKEQARNYSKIYCIDWALANINNWVWDGTYSRSLENLVYVHLKRLGYKINYYLTRDKRQEIDFVVTNNNGKIIHLIQVCYSISDEQVLKRELEPLIKAMKYFEIDESIVITAYADQQWIFDKYRIKAIPAWKWLIEG
ncbi:MAG: ATP-binding protein [Bacteroidales bacterium]